MRDWREDFFEDGKLYILLTKGEKEGEREGSREKLRGTIVCAAGLGSSPLRTMEGGLQVTPWGHRPGGLREKLWVDQLEAAGQGQEESQIGLPFLLCG